MRLLSVIPGPPPRDSVGTSDPGRLAGLRVLAHRARSRRLADTPQARQVDDVSAALQRNFQVRNTAR